MFQLHLQVLRLLHLLIQRPLQLPGLILRLIQLETQKMQTHKSRFRLHDISQTAQLKHETLLWRRNTAVDAVAASMLLSRAKEYSPHRQLQNEYLTL